VEVLKLGHVVLYAVELVFRGDAGGVVGKRGLVLVDLEQVFHAGQTLLLRGNVCFDFANRHGHGFAASLGRHWVLLVECLKESELL